ncbi:MAG: hypothetical protein L0241_23650 [Planctomycetia bacterium]|nr:hypothetical protein [Planctomycetia bacterium]
MRWLRFAIFATAVVAVGVLTWFHAPSAAAPLTAEDATKLRAVIRPLDGEDPFDTIPWETSLWEARKKAAAAGKPILLWEMDGHPLGCG